VEPGGTSIVLRNLLDRIRAAHEQKRPELIAPLVAEFIKTAAARLELLSRKVLRKYAPHRAGDTIHLFGAAYERLIGSLQIHLPPAAPAEYFHIAATHLRYALLDLLRGDARAAGRATPLPADLPTDSTGVSEKVVRTEFWERFLDEVERLRPDLRENFDLHWTHGLTHDEIAERTALTTKQAKRRWEEVKLTLRNRLGEFPRDS
jgi:RNA polymerase sigma factor (sigma-70 family)